MRKIIKLYSVFVDIGSHSDGWEPEDETDVRFLGTFTTKKRAIQELAKIGYSYNPNDKDDNLCQIDLYNQHTKRFKPCAIYPNNRSQYAHRLHIRR